MITFLNLIIELLFYPHNFPFITFVLHFFKVHQYINKKAFNISKQFDKIQKSEKTNTKLLNSHKFSVTLNHKLRAKFFFILIRIFRFECLDFNPTITYNLITTIF